MKIGQFLGLNREVGIMAETQGLFRVYQVTLSPSDLIKLIFLLEASVIRGTMKC